MHKVLVCYFGGHIMSPWGNHEIYLTSFFKVALILKDMGKSIDTLQQQNHVHIYSEIFYIDHYFRCFTDGVLVMMLVLMLINVGPGVFMIVEYIDYKFLIAWLCSLWTW